MHLSTSLALLSFDSTTGSPLPPTARLAKADHLDCGPRKQFVGGLAYTRHLVHKTCPLGGILMIVQSHLADQWLRTNLPWHGGVLVCYG